MLKPALTLTLALLLSGCGLLYKVTVFQGNLLEPERVAQLKPGLTKRQVSLLVGSPSIKDPFHQDRWDYTSSVQRRGGDTEVKTLTLTFDGNLLTTIDGDYFPEQDAELAKELGRYGNLAREKNTDRDRR